jgi:uncharacterized protein (UPF0276 family)
MNKNDLKVPLGIEFRPESSASARRLFSQNLIDHVQVSLPAGWEPSTLKTLPPGLPLYVHSTFVNVLGSNDWTALKSAARRLRALRPKAVIDHFGTFIDPDGRKHGVRFDARTGATKSAERQAADNINRWRDLLGCPVYLENIPVSSGVRSYFSTLLSVAKRTAAPCALDLPHLIISFNAAGLSPAEMEQTARAIDPIQVHIGGLSILPGRIEDNHKTISPWLMGTITKLGLKPKLVTIEQSDQLPRRYLEERVRRIQSGRWGVSPDFGARRQTRSEHQFSEDLAKERASAMGISTPQRVPGTHGRSLRTTLLGTVEANYPFVYPLASLRVASKRNTADDVIGTLAHVLQVYKNFGFWYRDARRQRIYLVVSKGLERRILDFDREIEIFRLPKGARNGYNLTTKDKHAVAVFTSTLTGE